MSVLGNGFLLFDTLSANAESQYGSENFPVELLSTSTAGKFNGWFWISYYTIELSCNYSATYEMYGRAKIVMKNRCVQYTSCHSKLESNRRTPHNFKAWRMLTSLLLTFLNNKKPPPSPMICFFSCLLAARENRIEKLLCRISIMI